MGITSRKDEVVQEGAKFKKTSIITSEMTAEELRIYFENLIRHAKALEIDLDSIHKEIRQIGTLLGMPDRREE